MGELVTSDQYPLTANAVIARVRRIQEVMKAVMKKDTHYGVIPGCKKESLYKPGAEVLLLTFRIAAEAPIVEDLSTPDAIRYRVTRNGTVNGVLVASGIGECSSDEEKYKWRKAVCDQEFDETPADRKRSAWKNGRDGVYQVKQIRTNPADVANTILKMADKRGYVAMSILATAAGDIFTQDIEDLPPEIAEGLESHGEPAKKPITPPQAKPAQSDVGSAKFVPVEVLLSHSKPDAEKPWTKFGIKAPDQKVYGTFDENFGALAQDAVKDKSEVTVGWVLEKGKYLTVKTLTVQSDPGSAQ